MKKGILFEAILAVVVLVLAFMLYVAVAGSSDFVQTKWMVQGFEDLDYMHVGSDDTVYLFKGNKITAIDENGNIKWNLTIPEEYKVFIEWIRPDIFPKTQLSGRSNTCPLMITDDGILYLYTIRNQTFEQDPPYGTYQFTCEGIFQIFAISSDGSILWDIPLKRDITIDLKGRVFDPALIKAAGDRVYVFQGNEQTVIARNGTLLFNIGNVSAPAAVDENGFLYIVPGTRNRGMYTNFDKYYWSNIRMQFPSSTVEAYYPDGTLFWSHDINEQIYLEYLMEQFNEKYGTLPIYDNNTIYIPVKDGILAMNTDGTIKWMKRYENFATLQLFEYMPLDDNGNIYLKSLYYPQSSIYVINEEGKEVSAETGCDLFNNFPLAASDGVLYFTDRAIIPDGRTLDDLEPVKLYTFDIKKGTKKWEYTFPLYLRNKLTINETNVDDIFDWYYVQDIKGKNPYVDAARNNISYMPVVRSEWSVDVLPDKDRVYVNYHNMNYEYPVLFNQSHIVYYSGIYALDMNGKLIWQRSTDSFIRQMNENNGTVYYNTNDGRVFATKIDLATGIAIAAAAYIFIRFFLIGAIARAKERLDKNENRIFVLKYIVEHPGSTLYEISRGVDMNIGTVRYHLAILGMNHRITSQRADSKYVRYFPNSNSYSKEEQVVLSLMRRKQFEKILNLLLEKPGMTNIELSSELGIAESMMSKYMKELSERYIVTRDILNGGRPAYSIRNEYKEHIAMAIERLRSE